MRRHHPQERAVACNQRRGLHALEARLSVLNQRRCAREPIALLDIRHRDRQRWRALEAHAQEGDVVNADRRPRRRGLRCKAPVAEQAQLAPAAPGVVGLYARKVRAHDRNGGVQDLLGKSSIRPSQALTVAMLRLCSSAQAPRPGQQVVFRHCRGRRNGLCQAAAGRLSSTHQVRRSAVRRLEQRPGERSRQPPNINRPARA